MLPIMVFLLLFSR